MGKMRSEDLGEARSEVVFAAKVLIDVDSATNGAATSEAMAALGDAVAHLRKLEAANAAPHGRVYPSGRAAPRKAVR